MVAIEVSHQCMFRQLPTLPIETNAPILAKVPRRGKNIFYYIPIIMAVVADPKIGLINAGQTKCLVLASPHPAGVCSLRVGAC